LPTNQFSLALERLVIQAPDGIASDADRLIEEFATLAANRRYSRRRSGAAR
jgi:hypothetical protein